MIKLVNTVRPRSLVIACAGANVAAEMDHELWITSGNDRKHMKGSKHFVNEALDFRTRNFPTKAKVKEFMDKLQKRLGVDYQLILESDHLHVEYDPKVKV